MKNTTNGIQSATTLLEQTRFKLETWRKNRKHLNERIPEAIWQEAASLCGHFKVSTVGRQLKLSYSDLKKRLGNDSMKQPHPEPEPVHFQPVRPMEFIGLDLASMSSSPSGPSHQSQEPQVTPQGHVSIAIMHGDHRTEVNLVCKDSDFQHTVSRLFHWLETSG